MITIEESGLTFGPFMESQCWVMEKSATYTTISNGVKIVEFALARPNNGKPTQVWFIEAKSSAPNPASQLPNTAGKFADFIDEIREKMSNALALGVAACLGRHPATYLELPADWKALNIGQTEFIFVLVINGHREDWLPPLSEALNKALRTVGKIWAIRGNPAVVLNEKLARKHGLIM